MYDSRRNGASVPPSSEAETKDVPTIRAAGPGVIEEGRTNRLQVTRLGPFTEDAVNYPALPFSPVREWRSTPPPQLFAPRGGCPSAARALRPARVSFASRSA